MCELNGTKCESTVICTWCMEEYTERPENEACIKCNASGHWADLDTALGKLALTRKNKFSLTRKA